MYTNGKWMDNSKKGVEQSSMCFNLLLQHKKLQKDL